MMLHKLSAAAVQAAKPKLRNDPTHASDYVESVLSDGGGLYLVIKPNGGKYWMLKFTWQGKVTKYGIGAYPSVSLLMARTSADAARKLLAQGMNPLAKKREALALQEAEATLENRRFLALAKAWHTEAKKDRKWSTGHADRQWALLLNWVLPFLHDRLIETIQESEIATIVRRVWDAGRQDTSLRVRSVIGEVYGYACGAGLLSSSANFMRTADNLGRVKKPRQKHRPAIFDPKKIGQLMRDIRGYEGRGPIVRTALQLLPLCCQRPGQFISMRWSDLNLDDAMWVCPPQIMKLRSDLKDDPRTLPHYVPLPWQAVELLRKLEPFTGPTSMFRGDYVFPSLTKNGRPISNNTINAALRSLGYDTKIEITGHGFRAMLQTLTQDDLDMPKRLSDRHLAHKPKDDSNLGEAYDRAQLVRQRRVMIQAWADYLDLLAADRIPASAENSPGGFTHDEDYRRQGHDFHR